MSSGPRTRNKILRIQPSSEHHADFVLEALMRFNASTVGQEREAYATPLNFHIAKGKKVVAGINANFIGQSFTFVEILWVDEAHRHQGLGAELLAYVEAQTKEKGGRMIYLDTYSFQARGFYEKQGYTVFGALENLIPSHAKYFLSKSL